MTNGLDPAGAAGPEGSDRTVAPASTALTADDARQLEACLEGDGVAVIPTDTVYGLACNPDSALAMQRIYELKGRPPRKPAAVMFFSLHAALDTLTELGPRTRAALGALLPGPVTLLLPNPLGRFPDACSPGKQRRDGGDTANAKPIGAGASGDEQGLLGLRVPEFTGPLAALRSIRVPAAQSSANLSGAPDPGTLADVPLSLRDGADLTLDGGSLTGSASTVVDLSGYEPSGTWRVVREGPVGHSELRATLDG